MAKKMQVAPKTFEEALAELEQIVADIESGQVGLEESLLRYERGTFLIQHCRGVLNSAEKQIELLSKTAEGGLAAAPMETANGENPA
jgi:exodeoxyribonuclease VII small subunit